MQHIETKFPNETVSLDLLGPYPRSQIGQYAYILVIVDNFSRWIEAVPLKRASAKAVSDAFLNRYILKYGAPLNVISDNGKQFVSSIFEQMCTTLNIKHLKTVTYRPQANVAERANRNIVQIISAFAHDCHHQWSKYLEQLAFALRTAKNDSTQFTPAELFLGRKIITPLDRIFIVKERESEFYNHNITDLIENATKNIKKATKSHEKYYNLRRRPYTYQPGQKILKATHPISSAADKIVGKFSEKFEGPYVISDVKKNNLSIEYKGKPVVINADQARPYYDRAEITLFKDLPELQTTVPPDSSDTSQTHPHTDSNNTHTDSAIDPQPSTSYQSPSRGPATKRQPGPNTSMRSPQQRQQNRKRTWQAHYNKKKTRFNRKRDAAEPPLTPHRRTVKRTEFTPRDIPEVDPRRSRLRPRSSPSTLRQDYVPNMAMKRPFPNGNGFHKKQRPYRKRKRPASSSYQPPATRKKLNWTRKSHSQKHLDQKFGYNPYYGAHQVQSTAPQMHSARLNNRSNFKYHSSSYTEYPEHQTTWPTYDKHQSRRSSAYYHY